jgi:hypothetical protein
VRCEQAQQFTAGIPTSSSNRDRVTHVSRVSVSNHPALSLPTVSGM